MPGLEASGAPLHATTLLSTARAEHRGGKSRLACWAQLTARVLCLFTGTAGVYPQRTVRVRSRVGTHNAEEGTKVQECAGSEEEEVRAGAGGEAVHAGGEEDRPGQVSRLD